MSLFDNAIEFAIDFESTVARVQAFNTHHHVIGIDTGMKGAVALLTTGGVLVEVVDMPALNGEVSPDLLHGIISDWEEFHGLIDAAVIEWTSFMPHDAKSIVRSMGMSCAYPDAVLACHGIRRERVSPAKWKRAMGVTADKTSSLALAIRRWPAMADRFKRKMDDGRAEAALIGEWFLTKGQTQ